MSSAYSVSGRLWRATTERSHFFGQHFSYSNMQPVLRKSLFNCKSCQAVFSVNILQRSVYQAYTLTTCLNIRKSCMLSTDCLKGYCMVPTTDTCYFTNQH